MYTNADCTLYNRLCDPETRADRWQRTALRGVLWQDERHVRVGGKSLESADSVWICIPAGVSCDAAYTAPDDFKKAPEGRWTLRNGDVVARGFVPDEEPPPKEGGRVTIVSVVSADYGGQDMWHWEVTGA